MLHVWESGSRHRSVVVADWGSALSVYSSMTSSPSCTSPDTKPRLMYDRLVASIMSCIPILARRLLTRLFDCKHTCSLVEIACQTGMLNFDKSSAADCRYTRYGPIDADSAYRSLLDANSGGSSKSSAFVQEDMPYPDGSLACCIGVAMVLPGPRYRSFARPTSQTVLSLQCNDRHA